MNPDANYTAFSQQQRIAQLWASANAAVLRTMDHNTQARFALWLADPATAADARTKIAALYLWADRVWADYYRAKALALAGDLSASLDWATLGAAPWTAAQVFTAARS